MDFCDKMYGWFSNTSKVDEPAEPPGPPKEHSEIEAGDTVKFKRFTALTKMQRDYIADKNLTNHFTVSDTMNLHDEKIVYVEELPPSCSGIPACNLKLIKKGDKSMKKRHGVSVKVDDEDLYQPIIEKAKKAGFETDGNIPRSADRADCLYFGDMISRFTKEKTKTNKIAGFGEKKPVEGRDHLGKLSDNWNELKDFFEERSESQPPSLDGHQVEILSRDGYKGDASRIKVGCWEGSLDHLRNFIRSAEQIGLREAFWVKTQKGLHKINFNELQEFVEDMGEYLESC